MADDSAGTLCVKEITNLVIERPFLRKRVVWGKRDVHVSGGVHLHSPSMPNLRLE